MDDKGLSRAQKLFLGRVAPATAAAMEAESKSWLIKCPACGFEQSVWASGGVRYKAAGTSFQLRRCPNCGRITWNKVYKSTGSGPDNSAVLPASQVTRGSRSWPVAILRLGLLILIPLIIIVGLILALTTSLTQPVVSSGDSFMNALKTSDYSQAYDLCAPDLQQQIGGVPAMQTLLGQRQPAQWNWTSRSIRNDVGLLDGDFTYLDGAKGAVHLTFSQINNAWKVTSFQLSPSQ